MEQVGNLTEAVEKWTVGGTALTSLMDVERRHGTTLYFPDFASEINIKLAVNPFFSP